MAMDKTTTRRMIGAIVLVLVAALVLAYLLKTKNNQPEMAQVEDVTLPSAPILQFPGDKNAADATADNGTANSEDQKVGLDIRPNGAEAALSSSNDASHAVSDASQQAQQQDGKDIVSSGVANGSGATASADASKKSSNQQASNSASSSQPTKTKNDGKKTLKDNDIAKLDNNKVSPKKSNSDKKKSEKKHSRPVLVGEKKLPKAGEKKSSHSKPSHQKEVTLKKRSDSEASKKNAKADSETAIPTTGVSIQILATSSKAKADAVTKEMVSEGYPAYMMSAIKNGQTLYRVRIGAYQDKAAAKDVQARMKRRYTKNQNVQNSYIVTN